jgi:hypothetical protein
VRTEPGLSNSSVRGSCCAQCSEDALRVAGPLLAVRSALGVRPGASLLEQHSVFPRIQRLLARVLLLLSISIVKDSDTREVPKQH